MDPKSLDDVAQSFSDEDKKKMAIFSERLQVGDSIKLYNSLVERCYTDCVETFWQKALTKHQAACVNRCAQKFLKVSMRVGLRFAELSEGKDISDTSD